MRCRRPTGYRWHQLGLQWHPAVGEMDAEGYSLREIAEEVGVSAATVCRILNAAQHRPAMAQKVL